MTLEIDVIRALRFPEYRSEICEELEGDITDMVMEEAADELEKARQGMTLRDYFAGQFLAGLAAITTADANVVADASYRYADAMLKARGK